MFSFLPCFHPFSGPSLHIITFCRKNIKVPNPLLCYLCLCLSFCNIAILPTILYKVVVHHVQVYVVCDVLVSLDLLLFSDLLHANL